MNEKQLTMISRRLARALDAEALNTLGKSWGFAQRLRCVTPHRLVLSLLCALATQKVETLADLLRTFNALTHQSVGYKPFYNQLCKPTFPRFMRQVLYHLLEQLLFQALSPLPNSALGRFRDLLIQDGTGFALRASLRSLALAQRFPGQFGPQNPVAVRLHTTMSLLTGQPLQVQLTGNATGERTCQPDPSQLAGFLLIADRGYEDVTYCHAIDQAGGHCLIRFQGQLSPTVVRGFIAGERRPDLEGRRVQELMGSLRYQSADLDVFWPAGVHAQEAVRLRLVLLWHGERRAHQFLLTNLERECFSAEAVGRLYRLRWQVELLFKEWKSYANLHAFETQKPAIVTGLIWASLAAALVKRFLSQSLTWVYPSVTASTRRVAMTLCWHLPPLLRATWGRRNWRRALRQLLEHLRTNGQRANLKRDAIDGCFQAGLVPTLQPLPHRLAPP